MNPNTSAGQSTDSNHDGEEIAALRSIVEGTATATGDEFFQALVENLAAAMNTRFAFVAEFLGGIRAATLAYWENGKLLPRVEWDLPGTPCEDVVFGTLCHHPTGVARKFPKDEYMVQMKIESYLGVPLRDMAGNTLGHLAVFDDRPMPPEPRKLFIFRIFAARAAAELMRLNAEKQLRESEQRYRDLYEEAPIAYIYEDLESRFVRANRAACELLGVRPDQVTDTLGLSLLAPTPDTQKKIRDALDAMKNQGKAFAGVELELRRKDNSQPIWVQWWSKPEPDGKHTRTMLVDITQRVLMEREKSRLEQQNLYLQEEIKSVHNFEEIVGQSPAILGVLENVRQVGPTDASVLITGETGTGKELVARAIHSISNRKDKPLIKVNCAALPTGLVESELFGHERGAFSGAISRHIGRFELAHGGTIFLDEVGEIPLEVQVKLLRVLQEHEFERVGGAGKSIGADVRVIAATNRDLPKAIADGKFREDLYYRLNVFPIQVPPLRRRMDDISILVRFLVRKYAMQVGKKIEFVSQETMQRLLSYPWPGNVRELENVIERAVILCSGNALEISPQVLPGAPSTQPQAPAPANRTALRDVERDHILSILRESNWVIEGAHGAATKLNMHPNTLRSRLKKLGIARPTAHEPS
jgi:formate hydrogenlyase transcriptional activator